MDCALACARCRRRRPGACAAFALGRVEPPMPRLDRPAGRWPPAHVRHGHSLARVPRPLRGGPSFVRHGAGGCNLPPSGHVSPICRLRATRPRQRAHRYNIRYVPEETRLFDNGFEAVLVRSTDVGHGSALTQAGVYYPQAWPTTLADERMQLASGMNSEPSVALVCRKVLRAAIKRLGLV